MANTTWNPSDKTAGITLSGSNLVATSTTLGAQNVRAVDRQVSGQYYWEVTPTSVANNAIGVANGAAAINSFSTNTAGSFGGAFATSTNTVLIDGAQVLGSLSSFTAGVAVCVALDLNARLIWFRSSPTGNWNASATANPATGIGGFAVRFGATLAAYPLAVNNNSSGSVQTANFGDTAFAGTVPSGFTSGFTAGASPPETIVLGALGREALIASVGQANLAGIVREALIAGTGLSGTITARSYAYGLVNATLASVSLNGRIQATSRISGAGSFGTNLAGRIGTTAALNTGYSATQFLAGSIESTSQLAMGLSIRLFGRITTASEANSRNLAKFLSLQGGRITTKAAGRLFQLPTPLSVSARLTTRSSMALYDPYHSDPLSIAGRITSASHALAKPPFPPYDAFVVLNLG